MGLQERDITGAMTNYAWLKAVAEHGLPFDRATVDNFRLIATELVSQLENQDLVIDILNDVLNAQAAELAKLKEGAAQHA